MRRFGSDKPDLRIALELVDIADAVKHVEFKVFAEPANDAERPRRGAARARRRTLSRKEIDGLTEYAASYGAKGLAWMKVEDLAKGREGINSPVAKFLDDAALDGVLKATGAQSGDIVFFGAGSWKTVTDFMGALRIKVGKDRGLVEDSWKPLWVTDFPMFEYDAEAKRYVALHHPFTAPKVDDIADLRANAANAVSRGYDMVLNGNEIGGGSIRIHRPEMQSAVFELLGIGAGRGRGEVRLPAEGAEIRRAAAWRPGVRHRSHRRADGRHRIDPRRDRVPQDHQRAGPDDRRAVDGGRRAAEGAARARGGRTRRLTAEPPTRCSCDAFGCHAMTEHVILLHGLWMRGFALSMLHRRLIEAGFRVHRFDYLSVAATQQRILERLQARMAELAPEADAVHLVGHSLGGLLALRACLRGRPAARAHRLPRLAAQGQRGRARFCRLGARRRGAAGAQPRAAGAGFRALGRPARGRRDRRPHAARPGRHARPFRRRARRHRGGRGNPAGRAWPTTAWSRPTTPACCFRAEVAQQVAGSCAHGRFAPAQRLRFATPLALTGTRAEIR